MISEIKSSLKFKALLLGLDFLAVFGINLYFFDVKVNFYNSLVNTVLFAAFYFLIKKAAGTEKRVLRYALIAGNVLAIVMVLGNSFYKSNDFVSLKNSGSFFMFIGLAICFISLLAIGFDYLKDFDAGIFNQKGKGFLNCNMKSFFWVWTIIFICWLPCYFAYYPGIFSYDIEYQSLQAVGKLSWSSFHPVLHTLFIKFCYKIGSFFGDIKAGLIVYSFAQMAIMSFIFSAVIAYMSKFKMHLYFKIAALLYFALNPFNAIFSFIPVKDVLFTGFFVLLTMMIIDIYFRAEEFFCSVIKQISFGFLLLLVAFFRNNALYMLVLFLICFILIYRRYWKNILIISLSFLILYSVITGPVFSVLNIEDGNSREALSVPMQQISLVVLNHEEKLTSGELAEIDEIIPLRIIRNRYNPRSADVIKHYFRNDVYDSNSSKYHRLWFSLFLKYP